MTTPDKETVEIKELAQQLAYRLRAKAHGLSTLFHGWKPDTATIPSDAEGFAFLMEELSESARKIEDLLEGASMAQIEALPMRKGLSIEEQVERAFFEIQKKRDKLREGNPRVPAHDHCD